MSPTPLKVGHAFGILFLTQIASVLWFLAAVVFLHDGTVPEELPVTTLATAQLALVLGYGILPLVLSKAKGAGPRRDYGMAVRPVDLGVGVLTGVLTQLILLVTYFPILFFVDDDPSEAAEDLIGMADGRLEGVLLFVMVVVFAPLVEEIFFRGLLLRTLLDHLPRWGAVGVQAAVFSAVHFQLLQAPGLFVFGLVAGALAVHFGRLGPCWFMHACFNAVTLSVLMF